LLAAVIAAAAATDYDEPAGRWGGLWQLARVTPTFGSRNPAVIALAAVGGAVLAAAMAAVGRRDRLVLAAAGIGFAAAHAAVNQAWQRYYEPMVLMLLAVSAAAAMERWRHGTERRSRRPTVRAVGAAGAPARSPGSVWRLWPACRRR
jgi:hypothetical protein